MEPLKTLIITPLREEQDFFVSSCIRHGLQSQHDRLGRLRIVRFPEPDITLARGGVGKAQFAVHTQHLLGACRDWNLVICAGAAGGLAAGVAIGDVVVATSTVEHDYHNRFSDRPRPSFSGAAPAIGAMREAASACEGFRVHFGAVASGDEDIVTAERQREIQQATGALAVAWQGAGGARACAFNRVPFLEIRGVTDAANQGAPGDFEHNLETAMHNIAVLIIAWSRQVKEREP